MNLDFGVLGPAWLIETFRAGAEIILGSAEAQITKKGAARDRERAPGPGISPPCVGPYQNRIRQNSILAGE